MRKSNRRPYYWILVLMVMAVITACDDSTVFFKYQHVAVSGWEKNDEIGFDVQPLPAGNYREEVGLRISEQYPFMGLSLVVRQTVLPSGYTHTDTLNCSLIDKNGAMKGPGLSLYQYSFHLNTLRLQEDDSLHIAVMHNMKREIMPGIVDVGIRLSKE